MSFERVLNDSDQNGLPCGEHGASNEIGRSI